MMKMEFEVNDFSPMKELGSGSEADIFKSKLLSSGQKVIIKKPQNKNSLAREKNIALTIAGKFSNLLHYLGTVKIQNDICLVYKYYPGYLDLYEIYSCDKIKKYSFQKIKNILRNITLALKNLHSLGIYHLDLKMENILVKDEDIILIDYGFSCFSDKISLLDSGTPGYISPEVLERVNFPMKKTSITEKADIFSLGVIFYLLLEFNWPFEGKYEEDYYFSVFNLPLKFYRRFLEKLIQEMLDLEPLNRPSLDEILSELS